MNDQLNQNPLENEETIKDENSVSEDTHAIETETVAEISGNVEMNGTETNHEYENNHAFEDNTIVETTNTLETKLSEEIVATEDILAINVEDVAETTDVIEAEMVETNAVVEAATVVETEAIVESEISDELPMSEDNTISETEASIKVQDSLEAEVVEAISVVEEIPAMEAEVVAEVSDIVEAVVEETTPVAEEILEVAAAAVVEIEDVIEAAVEEIASVVDEIPAMEAEAVAEVSDIVEAVVEETTPVAEEIPAVAAEAVIEIADVIEAAVEEIASVVDVISAVKAEVVAEVSDIVEAVVEETTPVAEEIPAIEAETIVEAPEMVEAASIESTEAVETVVAEKTAEVEPEKKEKSKPKKPTKKAIAEDKGEESSDLLSANDFIAEEEEHELEIEHDIDFTVLSKEELILKLEELVMADSISKIKAMVSSIKVSYLTKIKEEKQAHLDKYLEDGGTKEEYVPIVDAMEERFKAAFDIYKEKKTKEDHQQERLKSQNLQLKKQILEEIKVLVNSEESLKKTYDDFKSLQEKWKQVGMVPRNEIEGLWNNYHFLVEEFFKKVKINKELKDLDLKKNLEMKVLLCEKTEELLMEKSISKSFKLLQKYHEEWKEIGPVVLDKKDEIWERFKNVSDKINSQRKEYYDKMTGDQDTNLLAKTALCEKIEEINGVEIITSEDWHQKTDEVIELQKLWDSIGRAPVKFHDLIWERFRGGINTFYDTKKEHFGGLKDEQTNNYNLKFDICVQVEGMANSTTWKQTTADILKLQQDWKLIGPVPKRYADKIWRRFRAACDVYFKNKTAYFSNINGIEKENLKKKEELLERIGTYVVSDDKSENLYSLKSIQREWMEIGHVPIEHKDRLQGLYRTAINSLMDRLKLSSSEVSTMNYKTKIENIQHSPDAGKFLSKERVQIEGRINMLSNDIKLWENNIGFLASSKKASILKDEFEKKIQESKQELALLEAKLKLLAKQ